MEHPHVDEDDIPKHIQGETEFTDEDPEYEDDVDSVWGEDANDTTA